MTSLFNQLKASCESDWQAYTQHAFIEQLALGTLPQACFKHYLLQDYIFLLHFARAFGLAVFKSNREEDIRFALSACEAIVNTELKLHISYCEEWGISQADLADLPESTSNMAYTRYVLERGLAGDLLDLYVALAPCVIGYAKTAEWAQHLRKSNDGATDVYKSWIDMYISDDYKGFAKAFEDRINTAGEGISSGQREELAEVFSSATRLEVDFWQMGLDLS